MGKKMRTHPLWEHELNGVPPRDMEPSDLRYSARKHTYKELSDAVLLLWYAISTFLFNLYNKRRSQVLANSTLRRRVL